MAPTRLSSVKLEPPSLRSELIERRDLIGRLDACSEGRVTLIVAPAGYSKSTTVAQWLNQAGAPTAAWLSLDTLDNDLQRFCQYVVAALRQFVPGGLQRTEAFLTARHLPETERLADTLSVELDELDQRLVLVLDDYQMIQDEGVHELMRHWVARLPRNLRLVVLTRRDPPWPSALWHSRSWLEELRGRDLAFTLPETEALIGTQPDLTLSREAIALLHRKTEGWAAGLRLALLSLAHAPDPEERVREFSGSDRMVVDYLLDEVLASQPPEIRSFLAISAPMTRFCAPLCDVLLHDQALAGESREYLDRLYRDNLFLSAIGPERGWYRYHQLFRQLLLDHFTQLAPSLSFEAIAWRAGQWFLDEGQIEDGLQLLVAAGDLDGAADVVARHLHEVVQKELSRRTLARWLELFPPGAERGRLPLLVASGYVSMRLGNTPSMRRKLEQAEQGDRGVAGEDEHSWSTNLQPDLDNLAAFVHFWEGDPNAALAHASAALEGGSDRSFLYPALIYRASGLALSGRENEYEAFVQEGIFQAEASGDPVLGVYLITKAGIELHRGQLSRCRETAERGLTASERAVIPRYLEGTFQLYLGIVAYERDLLEEAEVCFRSVEHLSTEVARPIYHDALLGLAQVGLARSDHEMADHYAVKARAVAVECGDPPALKSSAWFGQQLALSGGRGASALVDPPTVPDFMLFPPSVPSETFVWLSLQRRTAAGSGAALEVVDRASRLASRYGAERRSLRLEVLRALAVDDLGRCQEALSILQGAVDRAAPEGVVRAFVDGGPRVRELLGELTKRPGSGAYTATLCAAFDRAEPRGRPRVSDAFGPSEVLTFRELETLELLAWRMTNKEIADRLSVSSAAIKKRLESIYAKLEVHDRRAAVAEAAARGLIEPPAR